jgi:hypothetical protein
MTESKFSDGRRQTFPSVFTRMMQPSAGIELS